MVKWDLGGRAAVVMAASRGLGRAVAEALARAGSRVALCSRSEEVLAVAEGIRARAGVDVFACVADVRDEKALTEFIDGAAAQFGGLDLLVTNAGGPPARPFRELDDAAWMDAIALNLMSVVRAIRVALPHMRGRANASIVSIVSSSVKNPIPELVLSNTLRPGIVGLARTLADELAPDGVRVNCVAPGRIDTERVRHIDEVHAARAGRPPEEERRLSESKIPLARYGAPAELADAVLFLASDAARYITGQTLFVDGGLTRALL